MRKQVRLLSVIVPFTISSLVAAARLPESEAREHLDAQGLAGIRLVAIAGGFEWRADGDQGEECFGTLTRSSDAEEQWTMTRSCERR